MVLAYYAACRALTLALDEAIDEVEKLRQTVGEADALFALALARVKNLEQMLNSMAPPL